MGQIWIQIQAFLRKRTDTNTGIFVETYRYGRFVRTYGYRNGRRLYTKFVSYICTYIISNSTFETAVFCRFEYAAVIRLLLEANT